MARPSLPLLGHRGNLELPGLVSIRHLFEVAVAAAAKL
jgi:hypothetical protein